MIINKYLIAASCMLLSAQAFCQDQGLLTLVNSTSRTFSVYDSITHITYTLASNSPKTLELSKNHNYSIISMDNRVYFTVGFNTALAIYQVQALPNPGCFAATNIGNPDGENSALPSSIQTSTNIKEYPTANWAPKTDKDVNLQLTIGECIPK